MQCCCIDKFLKHLRRTGTKFARQKIYFRGDLALGSRPYLFKHLKLYNTAKFHTGIIKRTIILIPTPLFTTIYTHLLQFKFEQFSLWYNRTLCTLHILQSGPLSRIDHLIYFSLFRNGKYIAAMS